jgi:hypothetical protein
MTISPEVYSVLVEVEKRFATEVATQLGELRGALSNHQGDPYAHQPARAEVRGAIHEIHRRLDQLERWRWILTGGLGIVSLEAIALFGAVLARVIPGVH